MTTRLVIDDALLTEVLLPSPPHHSRSPYRALDIWRSVVVSCPTGSGTFKSSDLNLLRVAT